MGQHNRPDKHTNDRGRYWPPIIGGVLHLLAVVIDKAWDLFTNS